MVATAYGGCMNEFDYRNPELTLFMAMGGFGVNRNTYESKKLTLSLFELSTDVEPFDFPFTPEVPAIRPNFWYAANTTTKGETKQKMAKHVRDTLNYVKAEFGEFSICFIFVVPPGGSVPPHRHFRENNTVTVCLPSNKDSSGIDFVVDGTTHMVHRGVVNFDSRVEHSVTNNSDSTYWLFVCENVDSSHQPKIEVTEFDLSIILGP